MRQLILYTSTGCHLCKQAEQILVDVLASSTEWQLKSCEIADSPELVETYGIRIPVVRRMDTGQELGWPFDHAGLQHFLSFRALPG